MCMNALTILIKINPNLSGSLFKSGAPGKAGQSTGISSIKNTTLTLKPGYYKTHPTFVSSRSQKYVFFSRALSLSSPLRQALITTHT